MLIFGLFTHRSAQSTSNKGKWTYDWWIHWHIHMHTQRMSTVAKMWQNNHRMTLYNHVNVFQGHVNMFNTLKQPTMGFKFTEGPESEPNGSSNGERTNKIVFKPKLIFLVPKIVKQIYNSPKDDTHPLRKSTNKRQDITRCKRSYVTDDGDFDYLDSGIGTLSLFWMG